MGEGRDADRSLHLVPRTRIRRSYNPLSLDASMAVAGQLYFYYELNNTSCVAFSDYLKTTVLVYIHFSFLGLNCE
jgi:hypothetical protein